MEITFKVDSCWPNHDNIPVLSILEEVDKFFRTYNPSIIGVVILTICGGYRIDVRELQFNLKKGKRKFLITRLCWEDEENFAIMTINYYSD